MDTFTRQSAFRQNFLHDDGMSEGMEIKGTRDGGWVGWLGERPRDWAVSRSPVPDGWFILVSSLATDRTSRPLLPPSITITSSIWGAVSLLLKQSPNTHRNMLLDRDLHPPTNILCLCLSFELTQRKRDELMCQLRTYTHTVRQKTEDRVRVCKGHSAWCEAAPLRASGWQAILHCESHLHSSHITPPAAADHCVIEAYHDGYTKLWENSLNHSHCSHNTRLNFLFSWTLLLSNAINTGVPQ